MSESDQTDVLSRVAGNLGAATACADVVQRHLILTLAAEPTRLSRVPGGQLAELSEAAGRLEEAGMRVLGKLNPSVLTVAREMVEVVRAEGELTARRASTEPT